MKGVIRNKANTFDAVNVELDRIRDLLDKLPFEFGTGSPNGQITAKVGTIYINQDGGATTTIWIKESGGTDKVGWVAK